MKKVRVIYDTDFFRKEQVVDYEKLSIYYTPGAIVELLTLEVIERIEEEELKDFPKTLEDKLLALGDDKKYYMSEKGAKVLAQIAKEHYLDLFDKARDEQDQTTPPRIRIQHIRNALEEA